MCRTLISADWSITNLFWQVYTRSSTNIEGGDGKMTAAKQAMQAYKASSDYVTPTKARDVSDHRMHQYLLHMSFQNAPSFVRDSVADASLPTVCDATQRNERVYA